MTFVLIVLFAVDYGTLGNPDNGRAGPASVTIPDYTSMGACTAAGRALKDQVNNASLKKRTMVFFESPRRVEETLRAMATAFGDDRPAALCRELTKTHEEVRRGGLAALAAGAEADPPRGEVTLVVSGWTGPDASEATPEAMAAAVAALEAAGTDHKAAMKEVAVRYGVSRRDVYDAVLTARRI